MAARACALLASALALSLACAQAQAQAGAACRAGGTVDEINACAVQDFQAADTTIAVLYGDVMRALSAHERPQLRQEHTAWLRARATQCKQATRATEQQADGPYYLLGWSLGGALTLLVAQTLEAQGQQVAFAGLVEGSLMDSMGALAAAPSSACTLRNTWGACL